MIDPEGLRQLVAKWRAEGARYDSFHATLGSGWKSCADELEAWLRASVSAPPPPPQMQENEEEDVSRVVVKCCDPTAGSTAQSATGDAPTFTKNPDGDWVCEHSTASDVHCCGCHSGFLFDSRKCVCF